MRVKIYGAGSIGNHLAQASRRMGWEVAVVDVDPAALRRMKDEIYPKRYGAWDPAIELFLSEDQPRGGFDVIFVGTPPDVRMKVALEALEEQPRLLQLEKPVARPIAGDIEAISDFSKRAGRLEFPVVVGYDYVLGVGARKLEEFVSRHSLGVDDVQVLEVSFREHWKGIFAAHPWLKGPEETYLGYWKRGGGASGEHSHAVHFFEHFAGLLGLGSIVEVSADMQMVSGRGALYDRLCSMNVRTKSGFLGRIVQDVVTDPPLMSLRLQAGGHAAEWYRYAVPGEGIFEEVKLDGLVEKIPVKRPDDFYNEIRHIDDLFSGRAGIHSPIGLETGVSALEVIAAAHVSRLNKSIFVPVGSCVSI